MVVIIFMKNILTTRENRVLSFNSVIQTRSYSDGKNSNSNPSDKRSGGLDPN